MRLAIDFDNTIVAYDRLFSAAACERALIGPDFRGGKAAVRDAVRLLPDGERMWQALQAHVYGDRIGDATPFPGVREFLDFARERGAFVAIVSHKTRYAAAQPDGPDLHAAARTWLGANGIVGSGRIDAANVYFEESRAHKVGRIAALDVDIVIDDLIDVFTHPAFPGRPRRWFFAPDTVVSQTAEVESFASWRAMQTELER